MGESLLESIDRSIILLQRMESHPADFLDLEGILTILIQHVRFGSVFSSPLHKTPLSGSSFRKIRGSVSVSVSISICGSLRFILREFDPR